MHGQASPPQCSTFFLVCCLARELHIHSIFLHKFMKGAEREEEFSDNSVEEADSEEGRQTTPD